MERKLFVFLTAIFFSFNALAQMATLDNGRMVDVRQALGADLPYPFDLEEVLPQAPEGYSPFYIEHYGRHGSRFAYSDIYYETVKAAFDRADSLGLLTSFGKALKTDYDSHYPTYHLRMGDLTDLGRSQQMRLATEMIERYPEIFDRKDASVSAVSSSSRRSMMSMTAFCIAMGQAAPELPIRADQGNCHLYATAPRDGSNPYYKPTDNLTFPFSETEDEFCLRKTGGCPLLLSKIFIDPDAALDGIGKTTFLRKLYILVAGMNSLNPEDRTCFEGVFTPDEFARMWETDNYQRYREYYNYPAKVFSVAESIVADADSAIARGSHGATLRFGHDHVVMPLLFLLHLNGYTGQPSSTDEISSIVSNFDSPMAANVQFILYKSETDDEILVNIRLNGRNANVDGLEEFCRGFYRWNDYKEAVRSAAKHPSLL